VGFCGDVEFSHVSVDLNGVEVAEERHSDALPMCFFVWKNMQCRKFSIAVTIPNVAIVFAVFPRFYASFSSVVVRGIMPRFPSA
jgi:hypothetical protein